MTWLAWRQFRFGALSMLAILAGVAVIFLLTGPHMVSIYDTVVKTCRVHSDCTLVQNNLIAEYNKIYQFMEAFSLVLPAIIGIFWGAPLIARELETGSYRLAWTQGITRSRWTLTKLAVVGVASAVSTGLLGWMFTWWASPLDTINANRFSSTVFDTHYLAPIGYGAFAFALGVTAGVLWRRTLPAMATTIIAYVGARLYFTPNVRPHLMSPVTKVVSFVKNSGYGFSGSPQGFTFIVNPPSLPNALVDKAVVVGKHGATVTSHWLKVHCPVLVRGAQGPPRGVNGSKRLTGAQPAAFHHCVDKIAANFHELLTYQPASRFWTFQWYETSIYLIAAVVLCAFSFWWLRRRIR